MIIPEQYMLKNEPYIRPESPDPKSIVCAAILYDSHIWTGERHAKIFMDVANGRKDLVIDQEEKGFLTNDFLFVTRKQARFIAIENGQLEERYHDKTLLSDYLW